MTGDNAGAAVPAAGRAVDSASATLLHASPVRCCTVARRVTVSFGAAALVPDASRMSYTGAHDADATW